MQVDKVDIFFIESEPLAAAAEAGEQPRPMFAVSGTGNEVPMPAVGDKIVFAEFSYRVVSRTFAFSPGRLKVVVAVEL
jgi:hypothetical protein